LCDEEDEFIHSFGMLVVKISSILVNSRE